MENENVNENYVTIPSSSQIAPQPIENSNNIPQSKITEFHNHTQVRRSVRESKFPTKLNIFEVYIPKALITKKHWKKAIDEEF